MAMRYEQAVGPLLIRDLFRPWLIGTQPATERINLTSEKRSAVQAGHAAHQVQTRGSTADVDGKAGSGADYPGKTATDDTAEPQARDVVQVGLEQAARLRR